MNVEKLSDELLRLDADCPRVAAHRVVLESQNRGVLKCGSLMKRFENLKELKTLLENHGLEIAKEKAAP